MWFYSNFYFQVIENVPIVAPRHTYKITYTITYKHVNILVLNFSTSSAALHSLQEIQKS